MCEADRYASWFEGVERTIVLLLKHVNVEFDSGSTPQWTHTFHKNLLKKLKDQKNFHHDALGYGQVHETLWQAKDFRNMWRENGNTKCRRDCQPYLDSVSSQKKIVEAGLLTAFRIIGTRCCTSGKNPMHQIRVSRQKVGKEREALERERKPFNNEKVALMMEAVEKCLADQEKTLQGDIARDRATLERERESHDEHVRSVTTDLDMQSAEIEEEKSTLQKALQDNRELEEQLWEWRLAYVNCPIGKC